MSYKAENRLLSFSVSFSFSPQIPRLSDDIGTPHLTISRAGQAVNPQSRAFRYIGESLAHLRPGAMSRFLSSPPFVIDESARFSRISYAERASWGGLLSPESGREG